MSLKLRSLKRSLKILLIQLTEVQNLPSKKRKEENHKFLFKRFFKYLQNSSENSEEAYRLMTRTHLCNYFNKAELENYFQPTKDIKFCSEPRKFGKSSYYTPCKLNKEFLRRLLMIESVQRELDFFMTHILPELVQTEIKAKIETFMAQFQNAFREGDEFGIFSDAVVNSSFNSNHKNLWSMGEVNFVIQEIRKRMKINELPRRNLR